MIRNFAGGGRGPGFDGGLFVFALHRTVQRDFAVADDNLHIVTVGGQGLIFDQGRANFFG